MAGAAILPTTAGSHVAKFIPAVFDQTARMFFSLRAGCKELPEGAALQLTKSYGYQGAVKRSMRGQNIAFIVGTEDVILDQTDTAAFNGLSVPVSTMWGTRKVETITWFTCHDKTAEVLSKYGLESGLTQINIYDPKQITNIEGRKIYKKVGRIKLQQTCQLIPPSWVDIDGERLGYEMFDDSPPCELPLDTLLSDLQRIGLCFSEEADAVLVIVDSPYSKIPERLKAIKHWVVHKDKKPLDHNGNSTGWNDPEGHPEFWMSFDEALSIYEGGRDQVDGLGFIIYRDLSLGDEQIIGGDLDACRDPVTGEVSGWAMDVLKRFDTFAQPSYSGTGIRFFGTGKLPDDLDSLKGNGPDDLTEEMKQHIIAVKPDIQDKLDKGQPVWNGVEIYVNGRHLTITDQTLEGFPPELKHIPLEEIKAVADEFINRETDVKTSKKRADIPSRNVMREVTSLPSLKVTKVIDINAPGWFRQGDEYVGPHPVLGSTTGKNLHVNPSKNIWSNFHAHNTDGKLGRGGDAWSWLACECGAVDWDDIGKESLRDPKILEKTLQHAVIKGLFTEEELGIERSDLEKAILFIDKKGWPEGDAVFGKAIAAKVRSRELTEDEYKSVYKRLAKSRKKYNVILNEIEMDVDLIPKECPIVDSKTPEEQCEPIDPEIESEARKILQNGSYISRRLEYAKRKIVTDSKAELVLTYSAHSAYLPVTDKLHCDIVGSPEMGKSRRVDAVLSIMPPEDTIMLTEVSPKSLYYMATENDLDQKIIYVDDAREEHIPVLKTFRNDTSTTPRNISVADGSFIDLPINGRPILLASSVHTLTDLEGQEISRVFLVTIPDPDEREERDVRQKIRWNARAGALAAQEDDRECRVLQQAARILRDEGIKSVIIPFDAEEPESADRRGTGQFQRLIKISAFINQYRRPVIEMEDGTKHVVAIYEDLENAAKIWFDFDIAQNLKIPAKSIDLIEYLPTRCPIDDSRSGTVSSIAEILPDGFGSQKTINRTLEYLYDAGIINRVQIAAPGQPWSYWIDEDLRQKVLSERPEACGVQTELGQFWTKPGCPKYMAEKSPDSLESSIYSFFYNQDIESRKCIRVIFKETTTLVESWGEVLEWYMGLWTKPVLNTIKGPSDTESLGQTGLSKRTEMSTGSDISDKQECPKYGINVQNTPDSILPLAASEEHVMETYNGLTKEQMILINRIVRAAYSHAPDEEDDKKGVAIGFYDEGVGADFSEMSEYMRLVGWEETAEYLFIPQPEWLTELACSDDQLPLAVQEIMAQRTFKGLTESDMINISSIARIEYNRSYYGVNGQKCVTLYHISRVLENPGSLELQDKAIEYLQTVGWQKVEHPLYGDVFIPRENWKAELSMTA